MNYFTAIDWLYGTQLFGIKLGLDNIRRLLGELDLSPDLPGVKVIHVAGTNGKGSVCAFAHRILSDAGVRTGLFTSPHLVSFRERIRVDDELADEAEIAALLSRIRSRVEGWENHPTFFEITLALALRHFLDRECEAVVIETGMGGRLDATNALRADVSVITPISLDHAEWLGDTLAEIAAEKAGILKENAPAVIADLAPEARDVVGRRALELRIPCIETHPLPEDWSCGLPGAHQRENAALAVEAACRVAGERLTREGIRDSVAATRWEGRFQAVGDRFVLDGAHNPAAAASLAGTWRATYGDERPVLIFGAARGKDLGAILSELAPLASEVIFVPIASERRVVPEEMQAVLAELGMPDGTSRPPSRAFSNLDEAWRALGEVEEKVLVAGSLYLVGEVLARLREDCFEVSAQ